MMLRRALVSCVITAASIVACGGSPSAPPQAPPAPAPASGAEHEPTEKPAPAPTKTASEHHREFMTGCAKKAVNSPDYCECAWDEFRKLFTDEEMNTGDLPMPKLEKLKGQVAGVCSSKIPEELVKSSFATGCTGKNPELARYCDCTWTEFRKRFSAAELGDEATVQSERFSAARGPIAKACGSKMPESVSKDAFMKSCAKEPSAESFCGCAWKELRKVASPAEIEAGTFDQKTLFGRVEKSCAKLRPATK